MSRRRGIIWLIAGLVLAILAAGLSYYAFQQLVIQQEQAAEVETTQTVVVASQLINERAVVRLSDVTTEERVVEEVPSGAIFKTEDAVGQIATRSIQPGEVILTQYLIAGAGGPATGAEVTEVVTGTINFNETLGDDRVAFALPATDRLSQEGILLPGDHIDLLFSTDVTGLDETSGGKVAVYAIQNLEVLQVIFQPPPPPPEGEEAPPQPTQPIPKTVLLAIEPQDATVLKYAIDTSTVIDLVLRSDENERVFDVDAVTINTIADRYDFRAPRPVP